MPTFPTRIGPSSGTTSLHVRTKKEAPKMIPKDRYRYTALIWSIFATNFAILCVNIVIALEVHSSLSVAGVAVAAVAMLISAVTVGVAAFRA